MDHSASSCRLVSPDVEAMFSSIPTQPAISLIRKMLQDHQDALSDVTCLKPDAVADLLSLSVRNCHPVVQDGDQERWFRQTTGLAMGKSYSPVVSNLYMGHWESDLEQLATKCGGRVCSFCRYADDYLVLFEGKNDIFTALLNMLNNKDTPLYVFPNIFEMPGCIKTKFSTQQDKYLKHMCTQFCVHQDVRSGQARSEVQ